MIAPGGDARQCESMLHQVADGVWVLGGIDLLLLALAGRNQPVCAGSPQLLGP